MSKELRIKIQSCDECPHVTNVTFHNAKPYRSEFVCSLTNTKICDTPGYDDNSPQIPDNCPLPNYE